MEEVATPASIKASIASFRDNNIKEVIAAGIEDSAIPDAEALGNELLSLIEKWRGLAADIDTTDPEAVAKLYREQLYDGVDLSTLE